MSQTKIAIAFKNIHLLWSFAQRVHPHNLEINTATKILICDCSEQDLKVLPEYGGVIVDEFSPHGHDEAHSKQRR